MILRDLIDLANKENRKEKRMKTAKKYAIGIGIAAASGVVTGILIKDKIQNSAETVKDSAVHAVQKVSGVIKEVHDKTESVKKDIKDGHHKIFKDIHKTAEKISKDIHQTE